MDYTIKMDICQHNKIFEIITKKEFLIWKTSNLK